MLSRSNTSHGITTWDFSIRVLKAIFLVFQKPNSDFKTRIEKNQVVMGPNLVHRGRKIDLRIYVQFAKESHRGSREHKKKPAKYHFGAGPRFSTTKAVVSDCKKTHGVCQSPLKRPKKLL